MTQQASLRALAPWFILLCSVSWDQPAHAGDNATQPTDNGAQRRYIWLTAGEPSGKQTVTAHSDGRFVIDFEFNDRGRGPKTHTELTLNHHGLLTFFQASGVNYRKGRVDEHFAITHDTSSTQARWRSAIERGTTHSPGRALYFPVNSPPEYRAILARALLAQDNHTIALLPSGSARIRRADTLTLPVAGESHTLTLYEITGLGLGPDYVWLDQKQQLIGYDMGWFAVMRDGWSAHLPALKSAQEKALDHYIQAQSARFQQNIDQPLALTHVRVLDVAAGQLGEAATVLLRDGQISAIIPASEAPPAAYRKIEGNGMTLMPALWDMHAHIRPTQYLHYVASGVLNVRDMANDPAYLARARTAIAHGRIAAPDIHPMGFIDQRSAYSAPTGRLAATLDEARTAVRTYATEDYIGIKLYSSISPQWVPELTAAAHALGLPTAGHIPSSMSTAQAIRDGYQEVTHINMILLQLIGDWTVDTRTPQRITMPGERGWRIDLDAPATDAFLDLMIEYNVALDPTLAIFMDDYRSRPGHILPRAVAFADHLPAGLRRGQLATVSYNAGKEEDFRKTGELTLKLIKRLHRRGVRILPGTDAPLPGFVLISELQYYAEAGIPNADILRMATLQPAQHLGLAHTLGTVETGKKAYLMLIQGNPLQDLSALRRVHMVIKQKHLYFPRDILAAQGIQPF